MCFAKVSKCTQTQFYFAIRITEDNSPKNNSRLYVCCCYSLSMIQMTLSQWQYTTTTKTNACSIQIAYVTMRNFFFSLSRMNSSFSRSQYRKKLVQFSLIDAFALKKKVYLKKGQPCAAAAANYDIQLKFVELIF